MNLCERLKERTPLGYGTRYFFRYRGGFYSSKNDLIFWVVERYSERFGPVASSDAYLMYERLAKKYSSGPGVGVILRAMDVRLPSDVGLFTEYAHPHKKRGMNFKLKLAKSDVNYATNRAEGTYFLVNSGGGSCRLCGKPYEYAMNNLYKPSIQRVLQTQHGFYQICRRPMCKSLCISFPKICKSDGLPMAKILLELTKNGDKSSDRIREIKEIAGRDIYRTHNWRNEQKRCKSNSAVGC